MDKSKQYRGDDDRHISIPCFFNKMKNDAPKYHFLHKACGYSGKKDTCAQCFENLFFIHF